MRARTLLHILFVALILAGIAMKRLLNHPELLPPFHISALLVLIAVSVLREKTDPSEDEARRWDEV